MTDVPPHTINELLYDLEFACRQHKDQLPARVIEALGRIERKRQHNKSRSLNGADDRPPPPAPPPPAPKQPTSLFDMDGGIKW